MKKNKELPSNKYEAKLLKVTKKCLTFQVTKGEHKGKVIKYKNWFISDWNRKVNND